MGRDPPDAEAELLCIAKGRSKDREYHNAYAEHRVSAKPAKGMKDAILPSGRQRIKRAALTHSCCTRLGRKGGGGGGLTAGRRLRIEERRGGLTTSIRRR